MSESSRKHLFMTASLIVTVLLISIMIAPSSNAEEGVNHNSMLPINLRTSSRSVGIIFTGSVTVDL